MHREDAYGAVDLALARLLPVGERLAGRAGNLERAGDRIVNICERIAFTATGELRDLD